MTEAEAEIAASLRTIKILLGFLVGAVVGVACLQAGVPPWLFWTALVICYFGFHWRIARADVDRERQRQADLRAEWAEEDRRAVIARADRAQPALRG